MAKHRSVHAAFQSGIACAREDRRGAMEAPVCRSLLPTMLVVLSVLLVADAAAADSAHRAGRRLASHSSWFPLDQHLQLDGNKSNAASCMGFLIGIGTQKGGTTAAWAYIKNKAHPMLKVSKEKEVGFWGQVHGWYKGCTLGDYLMLMNGSAQEPPDSLPLCPVPGASGPIWAANTNRLQSSNICGVKQQLLDEAAAEAAAAGTAAANATSSGSSRPAKDCSAAAPAKPWWWFWGGWHSCAAATPSSFGKDGTGISSNSSSNSSSLWVNATDVSFNPMFHVDITPSYLYDAVAPLWVRSMLPEARILVILREPVSRAVSNFNMRWQKFQLFQDLPPEKREAAWVSSLTINATRQMQDLAACYAQVGSAALKQPELAACMGIEQPYSPKYQEAMWSDAMIWQGIYADGLERWLKLFPANQFLIWSSEDFKEQPAAHMRELVNWLGLSSSDINPKLLPGGKDLKPVHVREYESSAPEKLTQTMRQFYAPHNERLFKVLQTKGFGKVAARLKEVWDQPEGMHLASAGMSPQLEQEQQQQ